MATGDPRLRIGELSRRVDVDPALLRAWEKRYGLLAPVRSQGNFRLYSLDDLARVRTMKRHLAQGLSAAEAARLALLEPTAADSTAVGAGRDADAVSELLDALTRMDERGTHAILDQAFALNPLEAVLGEIVLPCLREIGDRWQRRELSVAQEHFASTLLRATLLSLARGWSSGSGPTAVLACVPGEQHDIGLICFGLLLWRRGWRIIYLGQDTPLGDLEGVISEARPTLVVLATLEQSLIEPLEDELRALAGQVELAIAGADAASASRVGALLLDDDVVAAADAVAAGPPPPP